MNAPATWIRRTAVGLAIAVAVVCFGTVLASQLAGKFGQVSLGMKSGSMAPAIDAGDLVLVRQVPQEQIRVGDVVTYRRPSDQVPFTHRVTRVTYGADGVQFQTRGDANAAADPYPVRYADGGAWRVEHVVPNGGHVLAFAQGPVGRQLAAGSVFVIVLGLMWPVLVGSTSAPRASARPAPAGA